MMGWTEAMRTTVAGTGIGILFTFVLLTPTPAAAQDAVHSWAALSGALATGDQVVVTDRTGAVIKGKLLRIAPGTISVARDGQTIDLTEADVREVRKKVSAISWWAVPMGAGIGFAIGYVVADARCFGHCVDDYGPIVGLAIGAPIGAGIGAAAHGLSGRQNLLYRSSSPSGDRHVEVSVVPHLMGARKGIVVAIRF